MIYRLRYKIRGIEKDWFTTHSVRYQETTEPHIRKRHAMGKDEPIELMEFISEGKIIV